MIKKYKSFIIEKENDDTPSYMRDDLDKYNQYDDYEDDQDINDDEESDEDMGNLVYWITKLFNNSDFDVEVEVDKLDISIYCPLNRRDNLSNIVKAVDIAKKLTKDILPQYKNSISLFETKKGIPLLTFDFIYSDGNEESLPF